MTLGVSGSGRAEVQLRVDTGGKRTLPSIALTGQPKSATPATGGNMNNWIRWVAGSTLMASPLATGPIAERVIRSSGNPALPPELSLLVVLLLLGLGLLGVAILPWRRRTRLFTALVYLPAMGVLLMYWMLVFVCSAYGDCL